MDNDIATTAESIPISLSAAKRPHRVLLGTCIAIAATVCLFGFAIKGCNDARAAARKSSCRAHLRDIGLSLQNYHQEYGSLPPAFVTDSSGTPTNSWRTLISPYIFYALEVDYLAQLDLSKPWNDEANQKILKQYVGTAQCPSDERLGSDMTHYVAVVGEGTLWPGAKSERLPESALAIGAQKSSSPNERLSRILIVDWPDSNIAWTEPRDITKEEFLQWFKDRQKSTKTNHHDIILYLGDDLEVHELPLDMESSEVEKLLTGEHRNAAD